MNVIKYILFIFNLVFAVSERVNTKNSSLKSNRSRKYFSQILMQIIWENYEVGRRLSLDICRITRDIFKYAFSWRAKGFSEKFWTIAAFSRIKF